MTERGERFVTVMGLIDPEGELRMFPGFSTSAEHRVVTGDHSEYVAELVAADGQVLLAQSIPEHELCTDGGPVVGIALIAKIRFTTGTAVMRITRRNITLAELPVPAEAPTVRLTWEPGERLRRRETITWTAGHPQDVPVHSIVVYDPVGDDSWRPVSLVTNETAYEIDFEQLPGGPACRVGVVCTDGFNTVQTGSAPFPLPLRPCQPFIVAPLDHQHFVVGDQVILRGQGYWMEEDRAEQDALTWWSSLDGELGRGATLSVPLSPGLHTITLAAGRETRVGTMSVTVAVGDGEPSRV
jgi:hypothetical protein